MNIEISIEASMTKKLVERFSPVHLQVVNESSHHRRPSDGESHFQIVVVSDAFLNLSRIDRQRQVQEMFEVERSRGLHALTMKTFTCAEWEKAKSTFQLTPPACHS